MKPGRRRPQIKAASRVIVCDRLGRPRVQNTTPPWGVVHGGLHATAVQSAAIIGASAAAAEHDQIALSVSNHTNSLRPMTTGRIEVTARAIQRGRTQQQWQAGTVAEADRLVATGQVRLQNVGPT